jgi:hypothetical protein
MSESAQPIATSLARPPAAGGAAQWILSASRAYAPAAILLIAAAVAQAAFAPSSDVSWLITFCERVIAGDRPYVDIIESNPPAAFLIYMPAVLAAHLTGFSPEALVGLFVFLAIAAILFFCALILDRADLAPHFGTAGLAIAVAVLTLLPGRAFAEREHIAIIASMPLLAALGTRASGARIDAWLCVVAGLGGALMASIKPHLALIIIAILPYIGRRVGWKGLLSSIELYSFAAFAALGFCLTIVLFPAYLYKIVPLAVSVYAPVRTPLLGLLLNEGFLCWSALGLCLILAERSRLRECSVAVPALGSLGAIAAFLFQGKGWPYHIYPALALVLLAFGACAIQAEQAVQRLHAIILTTIGAGAFLFGLLYLAQPPRKDAIALERLVSQFAPHPKVLAIGPDIALGFPLTRDVSGAWVGTPMGLWITASIDYLMRKTTPNEATRGRYDAYLRFDRETLVADIEKKRPDVILVENDKWRAWAFAHDDVAAALADYAPVGAVGEVAIYGRKSGLRSAQ